MILERYSFGVGDRFGRQGRAQLQAMIEARRDGVHITPVWNKSHREHTIVETDPADVRREADEATGELGWDSPYFVDADHIGLENVDLFVEASDFFTLDVSDFIGRPAGSDDIRAFLDRHGARLKSLDIPGVDAPPDVGGQQAQAIARKYLRAIQEAGRIYRHIENARGTGGFITEVSMDEAGEAQSPVELFFVLAAIADEGIPAQTIAPKFTGRFNKGVDYVGDVAQFAREFEEALAVIAFAVEQFGMSDNLKLSVHSGSDKFSIYESINEAIQRRGAGLHLKTAGTTWLEELIGLALAGGQALDIAKEIYKTALGRFDEMCGPYATVIDIDPENLPTPAQADAWGPEEFATALRHDKACDRYNRDFRQLLHVGYKAAAEMGTRYTDALKAHREIVAANVTENIYTRHIRPVFYMQE